MQIQLHNTPMLVIPKFGQGQLIYPQETESKFVQDVGIGF